MSKKFNCKTETKATLKYTNFTCKSENGERRVTRREMYFEKMRC